MSVCFPFPRFSSILTLCFFNIFVLFCYNFCNVLICIFRTIQLFANYWKIGAIEISMSLFLGALFEIKTKRSARFSLSWVPCKFDFENGIDDWKKTGTAFDNQPTYGDNPTARNRGPSNHQGDWWIGGAEHRPNISSAPGLLQPVGPDVPQGNLTSPTFNVIGQTISFLIGGGCDENVVRAELIVGGQVGKFTDLSHKLWKFLKDD